MYSSIEVKKVKDWLKEYDKDHSVWENGFEDLSIGNFLEEYGEYITKDLFDYDVYKGWFAFRSIYRIFDRYFAYEYSDGYWGKEPWDFYEVEKKEYKKRINVVEWIKK